MARASGSGPFTAFCVDPRAPQPYLQGMSDVVPHAAPSRESSRASSRSFSRAPWPLIAAAVLLGALMAVAGALWLHYGTAVFFEIVRAGIAACF